MERDDQIDLEVTKLGYEMPGSASCTGRRRAARVLLILILLLSSALLVMFVPGVVLFGFNRTIPDAEARAAVAGFAGGLQGVPNSLKIVRAECEEGRDQIRWYKLWMEPSEIERFRANVRGEMMRVESDDVKDTGGMETFPACEPPGWWKPRELSDSQVLHSKYEWFVFSPGTGAVYVVEFSP